MKKDDFTNKVTDAGDAIITYRSQNSRRLKYNVCTMDFDNKYIPVSYTHLTLPTIYSV